MLRKGTCGAVERNVDFVDLLHITRITSTLKNGLFCVFKINPSITTYLCTACIEKVDQVAIIFFVDSGRGDALGVGRV